MRVKAKMIVIMKTVCVVFLLMGASRGFADRNVPELPEGFVYVKQVIPDIQVELRYGSTHNFIGSRIDGYVRPVCILTRQAADALKRVQEDLKPFGLGLKIFDGYRPQQAVDHFVRWAQDVADTRMKAEFYPDVRKKDLFREGYIASRSSHSRGSTVDLTIVSTTEGMVAKELDMGGPFDFFGPKSWPCHAGVAPECRAHRMLLQEMMKKHGFEPYSKEWWHFTLENEPFPNACFNFPVQ